MNPIAVSIILETLRIAFWPTQRRVKKRKRLDYTVSRSSFGGRPVALHERATPACPPSWNGLMTDCLSPFGVDLSVRKLALDQHPDALRGRTRWQGSH